MSLSERIGRAQLSDSVTVFRPPTPLTPADGLASFKTKVHDDLFARLGTRLFETHDEKQLHAMVVTEIGALLAETDTASALMAQTIWPDASRVASIAFR